MKFSCSYLELKTCYSFLLLLLSHVVAYQIIFQHLHFAYQHKNNEKVLTMSVLMCAKDGTLNMPWISSGGLLTPSHKNMLRPLARRKMPSSERRDSEQRTAAGSPVLFTSNVCCAGKGDGQTALPSRASRTSSPCSLLVFSVTSLFPRSPTLFLSQRIS